MDTALISEQDATVLLRLVIVLEGRLLAGKFDAELSSDLQRQFHRTGLISEPAATDDIDHANIGHAHLRLALANLNQRLRYALGDYDQPLDADLGWTDQYFHFPVLAAAERFLTEARADGERGLDPSTWTADTTPVAEAASSPGSTLLAIPTPGRPSHGQAWTSLTRHPLGNWGDGDLPDETQHLMTLLIPRGPGATPGSTAFKWFRGRAWPV